MHEVDIHLSDDALRYFQQNYRYTERDAEEFARKHGWSGFDFVTGSDTEPLVVPGGYSSDPLCTQLLVASNAEAAAKAIHEAAPGKAAEFIGALAYDYADERARQVAESIGIGLAHYPILNDDDCRQRERDTAISTLTECYQVPDDIADDVAAALSDDGQSLCTHCSRWNLHPVMKRLGYRECFHCAEWIKTDHGNPLHYDCADVYEAKSCDCISLLIHTHRHHGTVTTVADVRETQRGCQHCYPLMYPYGKSA